jgi:hypothetical protein
LPQGQPQQHVEIVAHHGGLGAHRRHGLELLELALRLGARFLRELERGDLLGQLGDLVAVALFALIAQLALDRLQLLVEVIFALRLLHLALHAAADLLLDLQHAQLALHEGEHHLEALHRIGLDQQRLLVGHLHRDVGGNRVGKARRVFQLGELHRGLGRQLAVELGVILELIDHRAHQRLDLGAFDRIVIDRRDGRGQEGAALLHRDERAALLAGDEHAHGAIRQLEQLEDFGGDAGIIQVFAAGIVLGRIELRDEEDLLVVGHGGFERRHRLVAADEQRHDHVREDDNVPKGKNGVGLLHGYS